MNEHKIIELYTIEKMTLRMIAEEMGTNHHRIKRILVKNGVEITQKDRIRKPFTEEDVYKRQDRVPCERCDSAPPLSRHCPNCGRRLPEANQNGTL